MHTGESERLNLMEDEDPDGEREREQRETSALGWHDELRLIHWKDHVNEYKAWSYQRKSNSLKDAFKVCI